MKDHGYIPLGKYSSARDSILHYLCTSDWGNDSFGDVEAPTGYVWRISNDKQDVATNNGEFNSILEQWLEQNNEVTDSKELRAELVGHFLVTEDSNGLVHVETSPDAETLNVRFTETREEFDAWADAYEEWPGDDISEDDETND